MSELIGLSLDQVASPFLSFEDDPGGEASDQTRRNGWGVAWYPEGELRAAVLRDPHSGRSGEATEVLVRGGRMATTLLVSHLRGAAKRANYRDTHPFVTSFAGRSWMIAHNGDLVGDLHRALPLGSGRALQPIGPTDTEHLFVWLLRRMAAAGASTMAEYGFEAIAELLAEANRLGTLNLIMADGDSLLAYRCSSGFQPLYRARVVPPSAVEMPPLLDLVGSGVSVGLAGHRDRTRSLVVASTLAFDDRFEPLAPGEATAATRGGLVPTVPAQNSPGPVPVAVGRTARIDRRVFDIEHRTVYSYPRAVERSSHRFRLEPVDDRFQRLLSHSIELGTEGVRYDYDDVFGNRVLGVDLVDPYVELAVTMRATVEVSAPSDQPDLLPRPLKLPVAWMPWQEHMMHSYLLAPELPESQLEELIGYARSFAERNKADLFATLDDIAGTIYADYGYKPGFTTVETTPYEVFRSRAGVCQDFANLMICLARMLNVPARYRVGYIHTGADYDNTLQSEASHAWVEVYIPMIGWRGYDPTNGTRVGSDHVRVAVGRNYRDAAPTSGVIYEGGGGESLAIDVQVNERS